MSTNTRKNVDSRPDYFDLFGLPHIFGIDVGKLEKQFHALQSEHHPDRHTQSDIEIRAHVLDRSSDINRAYRTLKDQISRTRYLLSLYRPDGKSVAQIPPGLLMSVMEVHERISELSAADPKEKARILRQLEPQIHDYMKSLTRLDQERAALSMEWDQGGSEKTSARHDAILDRLTAILAERGYINTLLGSIQAAERGESMILKH